MEEQSTKSRDGVVSVVIVNFRGAQDTITCVRAFDAIEWPKDRLEIVVVDNDSGDGSEELLRSELPDVRVIQSGGNLGFAGGCNLGVREATGEHVAFINNDARPGSTWISAAVEAMAADPAIGAVASKVLDWDGELIDFVDGSLTWFGMGYKREATWPDSPEYDEPKDVLFGTGAAMLMRRDLFLEVGGFDERFFMFYEDVDLGWRLNILGWRVRYVPGSVAYHKHHVTMKKFGQYRENYLLERNALMSMYKNLDDVSLAKALPAAMGLAVRRGLAQGGVDATALDLQRSPGGDDVGSLEIPKLGLTGAYAVDYFVDNIATLAESRAQLQAARRRTDRDIFPLFRHAIEPAYPIESYLAAHAALVQAFGIDEHFVTSPRILVVTGEPIAERMAGPAIRAWEIAKVLCRTHEVRLVSTAGVRIEGAGFTAEYATGQALHAATDWADVIIFQGFLLEGAPWLKDSAKILVADIYDPMHLEQLEQAKDLGEAGRAVTISEITRILNDQLVRGDFFLCASQKQRDFWLGQLAGMGRVNARVYDQDPSLDSLIEVVPFGIQDDPPVQRRHGIKGTVPGISSTDKVILWGGGIYNWFDPLTLIRAVGRLSSTHPEVRLFFMGLKHPNPGVPDMRIAWEARELADELGLTDRIVFFNEGWVPYHERADLLLDADVGVSTHFHHIETAFSFRTRILDYLWCSLPIVATQGDAFGDLIAQRGLGVAVPPEDEEALVQALERMLYDEEARAAATSAIQVVAQEYRWSRVLQPLVDFCRTPLRAPDLVERLGGAGAVAHAFPPRPSSLKGDLALMREYFQAGGVREVVSRAKGRVIKVIGSR